MHSISSYVRRPAPSSENLLGKTLPSAPDAERAVLGAILLNDEQLSLVSELLVPADFYVPAHQHIFTAMVSLAGQRQRIDVISLRNELEKLGQLEAIGGVVYLISLQEDIPAVGLVEQHAKIVKEKSVLRELINSATSIITQCYAQNDRDIAMVLDEAEKTIMTIGSKRSRQSFVQLTIWLKKTFQHLSELKGTRGVTGIASGYRRLDDMTSGFQNGDFVVLAARPSMGKTALALSLAERAASQGGVVGFFSLEMSAEQLTLRMLASQARVPLHKIRNATISSDEWVSLTNAAATLAEYPLFIDDTAMQSIMDVRAKARKLKLENNLQLIVIDYLQLIHGHRQHENRHQEVSEISRSLKALAKELNVPVIALSQLSRAVDSRLDKRPMLSDLRESGAIEQDADVIMFLYRDVVYNPETEHPNGAELIIGKQRNGPTGTVPLSYAREFTLFEDADWAN